MATTDTDVSQLVINKLTKAQYDGITTPSDTELYFVDDGKTYATTDMLATVATSGSYTDLTNKPTIPAAQVNSDWNASSGVAEILNKPSLATVATSGSYNDLSNKPTIPAAQVNSDWDALSGVAQILNKPSLATVATSGLYSDLTGTPTLATVATTGAYSDLTGKPTIPTVNNATLTIQKNGTTVDTFTANASVDKIINLAVPTVTSDLNNDSGFLTTSTLPVATTNSLGVVQVGSGLAVSSGGVLSATGGGTADDVAWGHITGTMVDQTDLKNALDAKVDSSSLATVATSGSYNDLLNTPTIPTVNNATLTIQKNSTTVDTFTANASADKTINITVPVTAADVSALPASTKYGASFTASINTTTYVMTLTLKDQDGNTLGTAQTIDLPLESVVVNGSYDSTNKKIVLTLQSGSTIDIPVGDLISGLQSEITSSNMLDADLVDDSTSTHKFTTASDISKLAGIAAGAEVNVQSDWNQTTNTADDYIKNKPSLATVATSGAYSDLSGTPSLATVATSGSYNDLSNKPTIPAAQVNSDWDSTSGVSKILNKPTLSTVATSGSYNDLTNKPTIPAAQVQSNWTQTTTTAVDYIKNKPNLATVATSGSYNDLSNKPSIPAAQVNSDWDASSGVAQILNKPSLATVATSGSYNDLTNKPTIPTVNNATLTIQKNGTNVQTFTANQSSNATANITVPTKTSDLNNDSGFLTTIPTASASTLGGIKVGTGLSITDGVLSTQSTAPDWSDITNKPSFATVATSGSYNDLSNKPTIPTVNNATLTIQKNGTTVKTFTANASSNVTANITVPTTVAELTDSTDYVTTTALSSALSSKQDALTAGNHISISSNTISATDYVHSENPVSTSAVTPIVTGSMISNGTITADKLATGAAMQLTMSTSDIGEGSPLAANTLYGVYI